MLADIDSSTAEFRLAGLLVVLLLACLAGLAFVLWVRKWVKDEGPATRQDAGFTLSDLRELHKSGKMTTEEFERAREKIVAHARRTMPPTALARPAGGAARPPATPPPLPRPGPDAPDGGQTAG
jgi:hypothetical protein